MKDYPVMATGPSGPDEWKKRQEAIKRKLAAAAGKSDAKILDATNQEEQRDMPTIQDNCQMVRRLVDEGLEMYREGDMELAEMVEDLHLSLKALVSVVGTGKGSKKKAAEKDEDEE